MAEEWRSSATPQLPSAAPSARLARSLLPVALLHETLAQSDRGWRDLHQLIIGNELERAFQREQLGRLELDRFISAGGADVRKLLALGDVDLEVASAGVLTD